MSGKEKFDAYMKMAEFGWKSFDGRRQFEWKVTLGFWGLLVTTAVFALKLKEPDSLETIAWLKCLVPISVLLHAFVWQRGVWVANRNDKAIAEHFLKAADSVVRDPGFVTDAMPSKLEWKSLKWGFGFLGDWAQLFQVLATVLFAIALGFVVWRPLP